MHQLKYRSSSLLASVLSGLRSSTANDDVSLMNGRLPHSSDLIASITGNASD